MYTFLIELNKIPYFRPPTLMELFENLVVKVALRRLDESIYAVDAVKHSGWKSENTQLVSVTKSSADKRQEIRIPSPAASKPNMTVRFKKRVFQKLKINIGSTKTLTTG